MNIEYIDADTNDTLERLSVERNESKGSIALSICENFFGKGGAHPAPEQPLSPGK